MKILVQKVTAAWKSNGTAKIWDPWGLVNNESHAVLWRPEVCATIVLDSFQWGKATLFYLYRNSSSLQRCPQRCHFQDCFCGRFFQQLAVKMYNFTATVPRFPKEKQLWELFSLYHSLICFKYTYFVRITPTRSHSQETFF